MTYDSNLMKLGSNLYNNISTQSLDSLGTMTGYSMIGDTYNGLMNGLTNYFQTKSNYYLQSTEMYNQAIPLYQRIGAQVREQMNNQANQYMNGGVDISQGTANYVISHTQEQGTMKLNEIQNNLNTINNASYEGNYDIITTTVSQLPGIKSQLNILYGDLEGNRLYNDYTKRLIKNYMGGRIASNNPNDVLDITKVIKLTPELLYKNRNEKKDKCK